MRKLGDSHPFSLQSTKEGVERLSTDVEFRIVECVNANYGVKEKYNDAKKRTLVFDVCHDPHGTAEVGGEKGLEGLKRYKVVEQARIGSRIPQDLRKLKGGSCVVKKGAYFMMNTFLVNKDTCAVFYNDDRSDDEDRPATRRAKQQERESERMSEHSNAEFSCHPWEANERTRMIAEQTGNNKSEKAGDVRFQPGFARGIGQPPKSDNKASQMLTMEEMKELEEICDSESGFDIEKIEKELEDIFNQ